MACGALGLFGIHVTNPVELVVKVAVDCVIRRLLNLEEIHALVQAVKIKHATPIIVQVRYLTDLLYKCKLQVTTIA